MSEEGGGGGGYKEEEEESCLARLVCLATSSSTLKKKWGEKSNLSSLGRSKCSSAHSAHSLIKKSTGMLLGSRAHIQ